MSAALFVLMFPPAPAGALDIVLDFDDANSIHPVFDPTGTGLKSLFSYAAGYYEHVFADNRTLTIHFVYTDEPTIADEKIIGQAGGYGVESKIRVGVVDDNGLLPWYIDPTPYSDSEFVMQQTLWRDLTPAQRADWFNATGPVPATFETGYTGNAVSGGAADGKLDMLSSILHEIGHALGLDLNVPGTAAEAADGDYDYEPAFVFGSTLAVETADALFNPHGDGAHLQDPNALMTPVGTLGLRRRPSHTDLLAMAAADDFALLGLPRREYYGGGDWNDPANWSGHAVPGPQDEAFVRGAQGVPLIAALSADGTSNTLMIGEAATVDTNDSRLSVAFGTLVTGAGSRLVVDFGGQFHGDTLTLEDGGAVEVLGTGYLKVDTLTLGTGTVLSGMLGSQTVEVTTKLNNDGTLRALLNGDLTFVAGSANPWNLDGGFGAAGVVDASSGNITFASGGFTAPFRGTMIVGAGRDLAFAVPWTLQSGTIDLNGGANAAARARLGGAAVAMPGGHLAASGFAEFDPPLVMTGGLVTAGAGARLDFNGAEIAGGTIEAGQDAQVRFNGPLTLSGNVLFRTATDAPADGEIAFEGPTSYGGGAIVFAGTATAGGVGRQNGAATVTADSSVTAGLFDLDGAEALPAKWVIDAALTIDAGRVDTAGRTLANEVESTFEITNDGVLNLGGSTGGSLTVNLPAGDHWWLAGLAHLHGSVAVGRGLPTIIPTMIDGSDVFVSGLVLVDDRANFGARLDLAGGYITFADSAASLGLLVGDLASPNRISGGTIDGAGKLTATDGHALYGYGTIASRVAFAGATSALRADDGTLTVTGVLEQAGVVGTADDDGILDVALPWNTSLAGRLELQGGRVAGAAIANGSAADPGLITGFGLVAPQALVNDGAIAANGGLLIVDPVQTLDLDGAGGQGTIAAAQGDLRIVDALPTPYGGTAAVGAHHELGFDAGWRLAVSGTLNLDGGASVPEEARVAGAAQALHGTVNVAHNAGFELPTSFEATVTVNLPDAADRLRLGQQSKIVAGAAFNGNGTLANTSGAELEMGNGASLGVQLDNAGKLKLGGGVQHSASLNGAVVNQAGAEIAILNSTTLFAGDVVNFGTFQVTNSSVTFAGTYTENGAYLSDPSRNVFANLSVNADGYLVGGPGDVWVVSGDFRNASRQGGRWDTTAATLVLDGTSLQILELAAADGGAGGAAHNFAWGTLELAPGASVQLRDGNGVAGAALYIGLLQLDGGLAQLGSIFSDFNVYYDPTLPGNAALGGLVHALNGGGLLAPHAAVPLPAAVWLFVPAVLSVVRCRVRADRSRGRREPRTTPGGSGAPAGRLSFTVSGGVRRLFDARHQHVVFDMQARRDVGDVLREAALRPARPSLRKARRHVAEAGCRFRTEALRRLDHEQGSKPFALRERERLFRAHHHQRRVPAVRAERGRGDH